MIWKTHPVFTDYAISDDGKVKRITAKKGAKVGRILRPGVTPYGYHMVCVAPKTYRFVHALVLETFVGPRQPGMEARHLNDVKSDNRLENLRWGSHAENYADRQANGGGNHGSRHGMSKLNEADVMEIRKRWEIRGDTKTEIAKAFNVSVSCVKLIVNRQRWAHVC